MVIKTRGRECHWHLEGREQGCYSTFYKAQDSSPQQRRTLPKISARQKSLGGAALKICRSRLQLHCHVQGKGSRNTLEARLEDLRKILRNLNEFSDRIKFVL